MSPDDPRHGTYAGFIAHRPEPPCAACKRAAADYEAARRVDEILGHPRRVLAIGSLRRVRALMRLGWSREHIAAAAGYATIGTINRLPYRTWVDVDTARRIAAVYNHLSMRIGPSTRTSAAAERAGWMPPLWWDDDTIDDPHAVPRTSETTDAPDPVVVERILAGDWRLAANRAERLAVVARWTGSLAQLEKLTGWNIARDLREAA